jgi:hypothetical protein
MKTYNCIVCNNEVIWTHQKINKYCSNTCAGEGKLLESVDRAKHGLVKERPTLRKVLTYIKGYHCECCGISEWNGKSIILQVDHKNGLANDNNIDNLRLICPNCHSQSDTFSGRNKGKGRASLGIELR